jgi:hypothetical protein
MKVVITTIKNGGASMMNNKFEDPVFLQRVSELYEEGHNSVSMAKILNCNYKTVLKSMKKLGLKRRGNRVIIPQKDIENICNDYINGKTQDEIVAEYPNYFASQPSVAYFLKKYGIEIRRRGYEGKLKNHDYFEIIDSEDKAYFAGLLMADGAVSKHNQHNSWTISIELYGEDGDILEIFAEKIGYEGVVMTLDKRNHINASSKTSRKLAVNSEKMAKDLLKYGICPQKTGKEKMPFFLGKWFSHFLRGFFDGDGTVFYSGKYLRFGIYSNHDCCQSILDFFGFKNKVYDQKTHNISFFSIQDKDKIKQFYNFIYKDATIYLKRKKDLFDSYLL